MPRLSGQPRATPASPTPVAEMVPAVPRSPEVFGETYPFSPGVPFLPASIDPRTPRGALEPRRSEFPTSVNLQLQGQRLMPFTLLRAASEIDIIRRCIEVRKAEMQAYAWDIVPTPQATKRIMLTEGITSPGRAAQRIREEFEPEMSRLRDWWEHPDRVNDQDFSTWFGLVLDEQLTIDAVSIYPRYKLSGELLSLEVIDGATIKPLLDHRGARPAAPQPAFQQILNGFARGEWAASTDETLDTFGADELVYRPRWVRTFTPYGYPPVEQALAAADVYLKRMGWIRGEFTEGATPDTWLKTDSGMAPDQWLQWVDVLNEMLVGRPGERRRLQPLPAGFDVQQMTQFAERYSVDLDELFIKLLCACFDVLPTQIGFPPKSGIGGKGHQSGEANSAQRQAIRPTAGWAESLCTTIQRRYLGAPPELQFKLLGWEIEDQGDAEKVLDSQTRRGGITLNDGRAQTGLPLYDFEEADEPFLVTGSGVVFLRGAMAAQEAAAEAALVPPPAPVIAPAAEVDPVDSATPAPGTDSPPVEADPAEVAKFAKFARARTGKSWRDFTFATLDPGTAVAVNALAATGDIDGAVDLAKTVHRTSRPGKVKAATKAALRTTHAERLRAAVRAALPAAADLVAGSPLGKAAALSDDRAAAQEYVSGKLKASKLQAPIEEMLTDGHAAGFEAAGLDPEDADEGDRLDELLNDDGDRADRLAVVVVAGVAGALVARTDDTEAAIDEFLDGDYAETFAGVELTAPLSAGTLDGCDKAEIARVRVAASEGDCSFCGDYDGRIMTTDEEGGMPPLHNGCTCDLEPLP